MVCVCVVGWCVSTEKKKELKLTKGKAFKVKKSRKLGDWGKNRHSRHRKSLNKRIKVIKNG